MISTRSSPRCERVRRGDGHVVEQAEAHGAIGFGVMAGRAHDAESAIELAVEDPVHGIAGRPRGEQGGGVRPRAGLGVGVEAHGAPGGGGHRGHVCGGVHALQLFARGVPRRHRLQPPFEIGVEQPEADRIQPLRPLRMSGSGIVLAEDRRVIDPNPSARDHEPSLRYSSWASFKTGRSGSASFQSASRS